jgi:hypothetical protein
MQIVLIVLAVIGAIAVASILGIWLMHGTMMGGGMACCGVSNIVYGFILLLMLVVIGAAIYACLRRKRLQR